MLLAMPSTMAGSHNIWIQNNCFVQFLLSTYGCWRRLLIEILNQDTAMDCTARSPNLSYYQPPRALDRAPRLSPRRFQIKSCTCLSWGIHRQNGRSMFSTDRQKRTQGINRIRIRTGAADQFEDRRYFDRFGRILLENQLRSTHLALGGKRYSRRAEN